MGSHLKKNILHPYCVRLATGSFEFHHGPFSPSPHDCFVLQGRAAKEPKARGRWRVRSTILKAKRFSRHVLTFKTFFNNLIVLMLPCWWGSFEIGNPLAQIQKVQVRAFNNNKKSKV